MPAHGPTPLLSLSAGLLANGVSVLANLLTNHPAGGTAIAHAGALPLLMTLLTTHAPNVRTNTAGRAAWRPRCAPAMAGPCGRAHQVSSAGPWQGKGEGASQLGADTKLGSQSKSLSC
jgi:hypothetical protein